MTDPDDEPIVYRRVSAAPFLTEDERNATPPPPFPKFDPVADRRKRNKSARQSRRTNRRSK